ncbi:aspartyl/asparaginyl beta-hydroxylase domain-containing protein [Mycobacterium sp.]|uniref:aspartyl/asparaginyl beta-hydroxylase domain-containing protein n=1 Tax=Mycobacterium sp. TaxID=1785 RepID=UPI003BAF8625
MSEQTVDSGYDRIAFISAQVRQHFSSNDDDIRAAALVEAGLRTGFGKPVTPPDPLQQPLNLYPGLEARAWHDPSRFDWVPALEAQAPRIAAEMSDLFTRNVFALVHQEVDRGLANAGSWTSHRLYSEGVRNEAGWDLAPVTTAAIARIPGVDSAGLVSCAAVTGGTHISAHCGPNNARLRCHLGLKVPPGCAIRVGRETRTWVENKVIIFDDSFEHEIWHKGTGTRLVLIFDIWHPDLSDADRRAIMFGRRLLYPEN